MKKEESLAEILLKKEFITKEKLDEVLNEQKTTGLPIQKILIDKGYLSQQQLAQAIASQLDIPYVELGKEKLDAQTIKMVPEELARRFKAVPVKLEGSNLFVAFVSPLNLPARDELKYVTNYEIVPMISTEKEIIQALDKYYRIEDVSKQALIDIRMQKLKERKVKEETIAVEEETGKVENLPVVRLVNDMINGAVRAKASDIHLEPQDPEMIVRYRVDGILHDIMTIPKHIEAPVVSRIKIMANMDITERRLPQDGHISIKREEKSYDFRVSTLAHINGEKVVMRILDRSTMLIPLKKLGLTEHDEGVFRRLISKPYGMILLTGPTGSGKTTTLYAVLSQMDSESKNIITIENPVEYKLNRINQIQVDPTTKITFASGMRNILRQDPDIIMVGEIRDAETADIAIQAALTGHLVFSTLHTNDAPSAVTRLVDMGIEPFLIASTVIGTLAQRLCRTICPECREEYTPSKEEQDFLRQTPDAQRPPRRDVGERAGMTNIARGKGCDYCYNSGFKGREGIFELMEITDEIRELILDRSSVIKIKELATKQGMKTLQQNGLKKVVDKASTIEEVKRVVYVEQGK